MRLFILIVLLCLAQPVAAQIPAGEGVPEDRKEHLFDGTIVTITYENDLIGRGTDQHYTNGARLRWFDIGTDFPQIAHTIDKLVPIFTLNDSSSVYYSLGHNLYTPDDIEQFTLMPGDRPWAAFLYASIGMATLDNGHIDEMEATLGVVGPWAMGEQIQKFVHRHITDSPTPRGWRHQLDNEPALILSWQRRWPGFRRADFVGMVFTAAPYFGGSVGNVYTYGSAGLSFRLSPIESLWEDTPLRVRPAMPGTGYFTPKEHGLGWYLFGGVEGRAVLWNIFLDGNTFADSHRVDKLPFVFDANAGIALTWNRTRLSYTMVWRSKEFERQSRADLFGAISLAYRF